MHEKDFFDSINNINKYGYSNKVISTFFSSGTEILNSAAKKARIKDSFKSTYFEPTATISLYHKSNKTSSNFNLFYDLHSNEIVFNMDIPFWENIKNIKDSFWTELIESSQNLDFKFYPDSPPFFNKKTTPEFSSNFKSINFNLMCSYITSMLEPKKERENIQFGWLEKTWTPNDSTETITTQLYQCFKIFYKFGYLLWKSEKTRTTNQNKRSLKNSMKTTEQKEFSQPFIEEIKNIFNPYSQFKIIKEKEEWAIHQGYIDNFSEKVFVCIDYKGKRDLNSEIFISEYCSIKSPIIEILSHKPLTTKFLISIPINLLKNKDSNIYNNFKNEIKQLNY